MDIRKSGYQEVNIRTTGNQVGKENMIPVLPLQIGVLYGPINSRRLGRSLGINLMPTKYKLCSFDCVYCHYGRTDVSAVDLEPYRTDLPSVNDVVAAVEEALTSSMRFDYLTFSGNGEPTLHPDFAEIVERLTVLRQRHQPALKIALLSNSSGLFKETVRKACARIDLPVFKLDVGNERMFKKVNRPAHEVKFSDMVQNLTALEHVYLQTVFMSGDPSNVEPQELACYYEAVANIKPREVQIYSLDRPVQNAYIQRVVPAQLEKMATEGSRETGVRFRAYYL